MRWILPREACPRGCATHQKAVYGEPVRYLYSVIRFVPDPIRGEFVNVGILAGSDESSEWELRTVENLRRARSLDEKGLLGLVWSFVDDLGRKADRYAEAVQKSLFDLAD